ncbi:hypothetical protein RIF29_31111 [Crotalaria pallida]|uniref:Protein kinase domain-containing protein n=1 Tax=Crotalaria pallida TaxID=3830 RepID=A0AAN9EHC2_CROPI
MLLAISYIYRSKRKFREKSTMLVEKKDEGEQEDLELPLFDLATIVNATNDFSIENKLGEGGFGPVYKGVLADGQEIAVKRLSTSSGQGVTEFKNEVILCTKLQHRNLVKIQLKVRFWTGLSVTTSCVQLLEHYSIFIKILDCESYTET